MIDAVDHMARAWAASIRARLIPANLDKHKHEWRRPSGQPDPQGHCPQSSIARIQELRDGAASRTDRVSQFMEEGHRGDALLFHRCLNGAPIELRQVAQLHYVEREPIRKKAKAAGWSLEMYYRNLDGLGYWVAGRLVEIEGLDVPNKGA